MYTNPLYFQIHQNIIVKSCFFILEFYNVQYLELPDLAYMCRIFQKSKKNEDQLCSINQHINTSNNYTINGYSSIYK